MARKKHTKTQRDGALIPEEQRAAAEALQAQIDELVSGKAPRRKPKNLRDFIEQRMAEDAKRK